jgi:hypothetical protein
MQANKTPNAKLGTMGKNKGQFYAYGKMFDHDIINQSLPTGP